MCTVAANGRSKVPPSLPSPPAREDYLIGVEVQHGDKWICSDVQELCSSKHGPLELAYFSFPRGSALMENLENADVQLSAFLLRKCDMGICT